MTLSFTESVMRFIICVSVLCSVLPIINSAPFEFRVFEKFISEFSSEKRFGYWLFSSPCVDAKACKYQTDRYHYYQPDNVIPHIVYLPCIIQLGRSLSRLLIVLPLLYFRQYYHRRPRISHANISTVFHSFLQTVP